MHIMSSYLPLCLTEEQFKDINEAQTFFFKIFLSSSCVETVVTEPEVKHPTMISAYIPVSPSELYINVWMVI